MLSKLVEEIPASASLAIADRARKLKAQGIDIIDLSVGQPDFKLPPNVVSALQNAVRQDKAKYTQSQGILPLREAIARDIARKTNIQYSPEQVLVTPGAKAAILTAFMTLLDSGDEVIAFEPCWHSYEAMITIAKGKYVPVVILKRGQIAEKKAEILSKITKKTKAILLNNPVNPTGVVLGDEDLRAVSDIAKDKDLYVLADETYDEIIFKGYSMRSFAAFDNKTILINGFSKTYAMPGLRIGYMIGPSDFIAGALKIHQHSATCASSLSQEAGLEALKEETRPYVEQMQKEYQKRRDLIYNGFQNELVSCLEPQGTFYGFLNIQKMGVSSQQAAEIFLGKARIASIPGDAFGKGGEGYLRISFASSYEVLEKAVSNFRESIK